MFKVSGDQNSKILVWDPVEMRLLHTFKGHKGAITVGGSYYHSLIAALDAAGKVLPSASVCRV